MWTDEHRDLSNKISKEKALERHVQGGGKKHLSNKSLKVIMITSGKKYICEGCGIDEWRNKKLSLELEHKDGDCFNNNLDNLCFLCPNCHSLTDTYRGRNKNTGKIKVSDEKLLSALKENTNIRQALISVGLSPRGGNYSRAAKLLIADVVK